MRAMILTSILLCVPLAHAAEAYVVKGTVLTLLLDHELEARKVKKGETIKTHLAEPIAGEDGQVILPVGSEVKGRVEDADERHLTLKFREIKTPFGKKSIEARLVSVDTENVKLDKNELESPGRSGAKKAASVGSTAASIAMGGMTGAAVKGVKGRRRHPLRPRRQGSEVEKGDSIANRAEERTETQIEGQLDFERR